MAKKKFATKADIKKLSKTLLHIMCEEVSLGGENTKQLEMRINYTLEAFIRRQEN